MKILVIFLILFSFAFPAFSQTANQQRYRALSDAMGTTLSRNTAALEDFDSRVSDSGHYGRYSQFYRQYNNLARGLSESERRLNFLLQGNAPSGQINDEHKAFENLLRRLETLKSDYDSWLRTVQ